MPEGSLKNKTLSGIIWSGVERFSVQGIQFFVILIIARILDPRDFGLIGMISIFYCVSQTFVESGFSQALIRKLNRTDIDNCTVFYFNIIVSLFLYLLLYLMAPWVADFYEEPQLTSLMRVLSIMVIIESFAIVQRAIFMASVDFKKLAKASFVGSLISGVIAVYLAYNGWGVWTLVYQMLLNSAFSTLMLWIQSKWMPHLLYSWLSFKELFGFGSKLLVSALLDTLYNNMYGLVIGKVFSSSSLGHYSQADRIVRLPSSNITGLLQRVTYPILCSIQDEDENLHRVYRKFLCLSAFIIFPLMCCLASISSPLITIVIGEKWHFAAELTVPLCFTMMWYPIHAINLSLLQVKGRSDLFLRLEIIKKLIGLLILAFSIPFGLKVMCWCGVLSNLFCLYVNTYYTGVFIGLGFTIQMKDISATLIISIILFALSYYSTYLFVNLYIQLIIATFLFCSLFIFISYVFKLKEIDYLKTLIIK